jgi:CheY-like chemotaxis protein
VLVKPINATLSNLTKEHMPDRGALTGLKIAIVEDRTEVREALAGFLRGRGALVMTCSGALEGSKTIKNLPPDLLVCEIALPDPNGFELLHSIYELAAGAGQRIPVIAMTGRPIRGYRQRVREAGFQKHLFKPFTPDQLLDAIFSVLRG